MDNSELVNEINTCLAIELSYTDSFEEMKKTLAAYINGLIQRDFQKLIFVLYRVDVNEAKLKQLLQQNSAEDSGNIIADLIIERQLQKIESRQKFRQQQSGDDKEERW